jgi:Na+/melibiose symporter-like transporter
MPTWPPLSRHFGKRRVWLAACSISALAVGALFLTGAESIPESLALVAVVGCSAGANSTIGMSIRADVIDYDEHQPGHRTAGDARR